MRRFLILVLALVMAIGLPLAGTATAASNACPHADNTPPNCGKGKGGGPKAKECGPESSGGSAPTGQLSGPVYGIGHDINEGGGAPLGDVVQTVACIAASVGA
jgi:hypothetical protein